MSGILRRSTVLLSLAAVLFGVVSCGGATERGNVSTVNKSTEISYFKAKGNLEVTDVTTDFYPTNGKVLRDPKEDGEQFVRVSMKVENTGEELLKFNYTTVRFKNSAEENALPTFLINKSNVDDLLKSKDLAQGETIEGALYFMAPAEDTLEDMALIFEGYEETNKTSYEIPLKS